MIIDGIECNDHGVPCDGFQVGDVVDWIETIFEIDQIGENKIGGFRRDAGGGYHSILVDRSSLRLVSRPRPKLEGWFNRYPEFGTISGIYKTVDEAKKGCDGVYCTGQVYMRECDPPKEDESNG